MVGLGFEVFGLAAALDAIVSGSFSWAGSFSLRVDRGGGEVLLESVQFGGAGDRHDHGRWASSQASATDRGWRPWRRRHLDTVDQARLCSRASRRTGGSGRAGRCLEGGRRVDRSGEEPLAERAERHEPDPELRADGQDVLQVGATTGCTRSGSR